MYKAFLLLTFFHDFTVLIYDVCTRLVICFLKCISFFRIFSSLLWCRRWRRKSPLVCNSSYSKKVSCCQNNYLYWRCQSWGPNHSSSNATIQFEFEFQPIGIYLPSSKKMGGGWHVSLFYLVRTESWFCVLRSWSPRKMYSKCISWHDGICFYVATVQIFRRL